MCVMSYRSAVQEYGLSTERAAVFGKLFESHAQALTGVLAETGACGACV